MLRKLLETVLWLVDTMYLGMPLIVLYVVILGPLTLRAIDCPRC